MTRDGGRHKHYQWWVDTLDYHGNPDHFGPYQTRKEAEQAMEVILDDGTNVQGIVMRGDERPFLGR